MMHNGQSKSNTQKHVRGLILKGWGVKSIDSESGKHSHRGILHTFKWQIRNKSLNIVLRHECLNTTDGSLD